MSVKTSAHYQREFRQRMRSQGLVKKEVWIRPEHARQLAAIEKRLRKADGMVLIGRDNLMASDFLVWTTEKLYSALQASKLVRQNYATVELIEGVEPIVHIIMSEYGDLPLYLAVSGEQIIVESMLWPQSLVKDSASFNEAVLKTHKFFPLSTISLESTHRDGDCYFMFGSLSYTSVLSSILTEVETLANNVLQATEAYAEHLYQYKYEEAK